MTVAGDNRRLVPLPCIAPPSKAEFSRRYVKRGRPAWIRGALADWPALGRWSPADFARRFGERTIEAFAMEQGEIVLDPERGFDLRKLTVAEYVRRCESGGSPDLYFRARLPGALPELAAEMRTPVYCEDGYMPKQNLWFSAPGTLTRIHFDNPHNLICMLHGRKRFLLYPFRYWREVYAHALWSSSPQFAAVNPEHPDLAVHPRFARARGFEVELAAGDMLYIPPRMYHYARSLETSISVNLWWNDALTGSLALLAELAKRARGISVS